MQLYRGTRVMTTDVDTLSMAAYSAAWRGRQSSKVGRLWYYKRDRVTLRSGVAKANDVYVKFYFNPFLPFRTPELGSSELSIAHAVILNYLKTITMLADKCGARQCQKRHHAVEEPCHTDIPS